jgi:lactate dehydrogenase-like 2-hydroxyacid dehydrogenase
MARAGVPIEVSQRLILGLGLNDVAAGQLMARYQVLRASEADLPPGAEEAEGIALMGGGVSAATLDRCPKAKIVCTFGVGYDRVDLAACKARGITLAHAAGMTDGCVADMAFALLLAARRELILGDRFVRAGLWGPTNRPLAHRVWGHRLGIYGMGRIGMAIARRAVGFDMPVGYHNRSPRADSDARFFDDLNDLAEWADFLVVACPASPATENTVDRAVLRRLGSGGVLVNIARGTIVNEPDLIAALEAGEIASAGLDVFAGEPTVPDALKLSDRAVLMPHRAGGTVETWDDCGRHMVANFDAFFQTGRPLTPVAF